MLPVAISIIELLVGRFKRYLLSLFIICAFCSREYFCYCLLPSRRALLGRFSSNLFYSFLDFTPGFQQELSLARWLRMVFVSTKRVFQSYAHFDATGIHTGGCSVIIV